MSKAPEPNATFWDQPPFAIDESPDPLHDGPEVEASPGAAPGTDLAIAETLADLQASVERIGRDLYKRATREETLFAQMARLRADVTTLLDLQQQEDKVFATIKAVLPLLDGLSNLVAATQAMAGEVVAGPSAEAFAHLREAVAIVQEKSGKILKDLGVTEMSTVGKPYDPNGQVVVDTAYNPDLPSLVVLEEESKGYFYRERVLRPAHVIVNKHPTAVPAGDLVPSALPEPAAEPEPPSDAGTPA